MRRKKMFQARGKMNLSHEAIAKKAKISRSFYTLIENGKKKPSIEVALRISKALNSSVEELFE